MLDSLAGIGAGVVAGAVALGILSVLARSIVVICPPNQVVIFSGRKRKLADGSQVGYRVVLGGRSVRIPLLERVDRMSLLSIPIDLKVSNAYSKGGIPLRVHAIANVKVASDPRVVGNAIERFLGRDPAEIARVAKESLEGHLRGVLANLTPEEVNEDRLKFATGLVDEAEGDFRKLGLTLDTLKIQNVSDEANYLASIGRARIAMVLRDAEMAESLARSEASQGEASSRRAGEVANQQAGTVIAQKENELKTLKAQLEAKAKAAEETAVQAALQARAEAEQKLQAIRKKLEETRLQAEAVLPAQAAQQAAAFAARGEAATIEENGKALADVLRLLTTAWVSAGPDAKDIFLIQNLEQILRTVVDRVKAVEVDETHLLDSGDGSALATYVASYPAAVRSVLAEVSRTTGVDVVALLSPVRAEVAR
ncbi:MAG: flotillin family protein [Holophagales bacterium]|nr:flotillin family protein [Holophagales bacterium]MBK9375078.1 flotillin family protein [Holophagales bacterium]